MMTTEDRIAKGVALLDEKRPGWRSEIDVDSLLISDGDDCVLGQLFGSYRQGLKELGLWVEDEKDERSFGEPYGFDTLDVSWSVLTALWRKEVSKDLVA